LQPIRHVVADPGSPGYGALLVLRSDLRREFGKIYAVRGQERKWRVQAARNRRIEL
jgi:hypothetical protein